MCLDPSKTTFAPGYFDGLRAEHPVRMEMAAKKRATNAATSMEVSTAARQPESSAMPDALREKWSTAADAEGAESERRRSTFPVAGLVVSAGELEAFKKSFTATPADSGVSFVLIPQLDPKHDSLMVELLARCTKMPVVEVTDGVVVEPNRVYFLPPNKYMTISGGALRLTEPVERAGLQTSIDRFLRSLADNRQEQAICVFLSGTGLHGSLGLKAVKASAGMAMVQDPCMAEYPRMPDSAVATGLAAYDLPVEQMPDALITYVRHSYIKAAHAGREGTEASDDLNRVLTILRAHTKFAFRCYRKRMLLRRIERRMSLNRLDRIADYLIFLREHPDEIQRLFRDLLILVTNFFRDPAAFQVLETDAIVPLVRNKHPDAAVRVWSAGCATGEEPYSLGILLLEQLAAAQKSCPLQIFATDVDEDSPELARQGIYPDGIATDVSAERLGRFFKRAGDASYQVSKQLRDGVIFARQNLISDASFSKLDLIVCRNVLIDLKPKVQRKILSLFHFSLNEGAYLFLGRRKPLAETSTYSSRSRRSGACFAESARHARNASKCRPRRPRLF
jgi:two-component system CheB/CheR fusion protein